MQNFLHGIWQIVSASFLSFFLELFVWFSNAEEVGGWSFIAIFRRVELVLIIIRFFMSLYVFHNGRVHIGWFPVNCRVWDWGKSADNTVIVLWRRSWPSEADYYEWPCLPCIKREDGNIFWNEGPPLGHHLPSAQWFLLKVGCGRKPEES